MDSLYILIPVAIIFVAVAIAAFVWAVNNRQYDDLDTAAERILFDDDVDVRVDPGATGSEDKTPDKTAVDNE